LVFSPLFDAFGWFSLCPLANADLEDGVVGTGILDGDEVAVDCDFTWEERDELLAGVAGGCESDCCADCWLVVLSTRENMAARASRAFRRCSMDVLLTRASGV
jgi:hypothetical protein